MSIYRMENYRNRIPFLNFPVKIDLGAGQYPKEGFLRLDFDPNNTDIIWDITQGIPLPDNSVSELYSSHFLEHLTPTDFHYVLQEISRVCQPNAPVTLKVPHGDTPQGHLPCHYMRITEATMEGIGLWFPEESKIELQSIRREEYHLIGEFIIRKV